MDQGQNYKNHARIVPAYHFGALGLFCWPPLVLSNSLLTVMERHASSTR